jgi:hypothetical protein
MNSTVIWAVTVGGMRSDQLHGQVTDQHRINDRLKPPRVWGMYTGSLLARESNQNQPH